MAQRAARQFCNTSCALVVVVVVVVPSASLSQFERPERSGQSRRGPVERAADRWQVAQGDRVGREGRRGGGSPSNRSPAVGAGQERRARSDGAGGTACGHLRLSNDNEERRRRSAVLVRLGRANCLLRGATGVGSGRRE